MRVSFGAVRVDHSSFVRTGRERQERAIQEEFEKEDPKKDVEELQGKGAGINISSNNGQIYAHLVKDGTDEPYCNSLAGREFPYKLCATAPANNIVMTILRKAKKDVRTSPV